MQNDKFEKVHTIIKTVLYSQDPLEEVAKKLGVSIRSIQRAFSEYGLPMPNTRISREQVSIIYEAGLYGITTGDELTGYFQQIEFLEEHLKNKEMALMENLVDLPDNGFITFISRLFESRAKKKILSALNKLNQPE